MQYDDGPIYEYCPSSVPLHGHVDRVLPMLSSALLPKSYVNKRYAPKGARLLVGIEDMEHTTTTIYCFYPKYNELNLYFDSKCRQEFAQLLRVTFAWLQGKQQYVK